MSFNKSHCNKLSFCRRMSVFIVASCDVDHHLNSVRMLRTIFLPVQHSPRRMFMSRGNLRSSRTRRVRFRAGKTRRQGMPADISITKTASFGWIKPQGCHSNMYVRHSWKGWPDLELEIYSSNRPFRRCPDSPGSLSRAHIFPNPKDCKHRNTTVIFNITIFKSRYE